MKINCKKKIEIMGRVTRMYDITSICYKISNISLRNTFREEHDTRFLQYLNIIRVFSLLIFIETHLFYFHI